jgi:cyanophycin synthetase
LFFACTGAVLELAAEHLDDDVIAGWRARVARAARHLRWTGCGAVARKHVDGVSLAIAAPYDQLFLATEVNEWALCATLAERDPMRWPDLEEALVHAAIQAADNSPVPIGDLIPVLEETAAFARFERLSQDEARPKLRALLDRAAIRGLPHVLDDEALTLGAGGGGRSFPLTALPDVAEVPWEALRGIPTAVVTGSNGKTTTVRLLAACVRAQGWRAGYNCTDGVFLDDEALATGDYSGPAGARKVMREPRAQAAIIETARGGILRRGIAISHAQAAVITNVSSDHFGEYGIHDLAGLADVKLAVAAALAPGGMLVLNADDPQLRARADGVGRRFGLTPRMGWFSTDPDFRVLGEPRLRGASTCGVRDGRMILAFEASQYDLGAVAAMPLSIDGTAVYNVANMAGAALAAMALGIAPATVASVFSRFGSSPGDNPGRLMRFDIRGVKVLIDYAHNPDGLRGFLGVATHLRAGSGRLGLLLGHAGNRKDADIRELAQVAAEFRPDLIVVKEDEAHLRGRAPGEIPRILRSELLRLGLAESTLALADSEVEAVRLALEWARPGDLLALPVHSTTARAAVVSMLKND